MTKRLIPLFIICTLFRPSFSFADETCGRTAVINYQEVLVDTSSTTKGEGLRFYIDKDEIAKKYLDQYQEKSKINWYNATLGTIGTGLILAGLFRSGRPSKSNSFARTEILFASGASILILNYLVARTIEYNNEYLLQRSVQEYNKRNLPKIYFSPFKNKKETGINAGVIKEF